MDAPDVRAAAARPPSRCRPAASRTRRPAGCSRRRAPRRGSAASRPPDARVLLFDQPGMPTWLPEGRPVAKVGAGRRARASGAHCAELVVQRDAPLLLVVGRGGLAARVVRLARRRPRPSSGAADYERRMSHGRSAPTLADARPRAACPGCARATTPPTASPTRAISGPGITSPSARAGPPSTGRAPSSGRSPPRTWRGSSAGRGERGVALVPFGAGSGVCAGVAPRDDVVVVDLKRMARMRALDARRAARSTSRPGTWACRSR